MGRKLGDWERYAGTCVCVFVGALMCGCCKVGRRDGEVRGKEAGIKND